MITSYHFKCFKKNRRILSCSPITSVLICINFGHTNLCKVSTTEASNCSQATLKWKLFQMNVDLLIWTLVDQTLSLTCSLRQDPKAKDWLHTKARRGALANTSALSARGSGWVGTPGPTWDRNASNAISMFILINRYSIHILTAHIMWHCITKMLHASFSNLSVNSERNLPRSSFGWGPAGTFETWDTNPRHLSNPNTPWTQEGVLFQEVKLIYSVKSGTIVTLRSCI